MRFTYRINSSKSIGQDRDENYEKGFFLAATSILESNQIIDVLVNNRVFDRAAKHVIRIGPKTLWKLVACANERYVLPNQIWTINQAIDLKVHLFAAELRHSMRQCNGLNQARNNLDLT